MKPGDLATITVILLLVQVLVVLPLALHAALFVVQVLLVVRLLQARRANRSRR